MLGGAADGGAERLELEGLGEEVPGAGAEGADGGVHARVAGHDDHRHVGADVEHALADFEAVVLADAQVGEHDVELTEVADEALGLGLGGGGLDGMTVLLQRGLGEVADLGFIIDDEDVRQGAPCVRLDVWGSVGCGALGRRGSPLEPCEHCATRRGVLPQRAIARDSGGFG